MSEETNTAIDFFEYEDVEITNKDYMKPIWVEDFNNKNEILKKYYREATAESLYIDLFGKLDAKCNLLLEDSYKEKRTFRGLRQCIEDYETVFFYSQFFTDYRKDYITGRITWYGRTEKDLKALNSFVIDLDGIRMSNIREAIERINSAPIQPNYIVNSGNGLHLYYIFSKKHDLKNAIGLMVRICRLNGSLCMEVYKKIKKGMINWFAGGSFKADLDNHLVQPTRLFEAKTKNPNVYTCIFKCSDVRYHITELADMLDEDLPPDDVIKSWVKYQRERKRKGRRADDEDVVVTEPIDRVPSSNETQVGKKWECDFEEFKKIQTEIMREFENCFEQTKYREWREEKEQEKISAKNLIRSQRKGIMSQYEQFRDMIMNVASEGNRLKCLHIFWNRAQLYTNDLDLIRSDFDVMAAYFQRMSSSNNELTPRQLNGVLNGVHYHYTNETIFKSIGLEVVFKNKKNIERQIARDNKNEKKSKILKITEQFLYENPNISYRELSKIMEKHDIKVSYKTLSTMVEVKDIRDKYKT